MKDPFKPDDDWEHNACVNNWMSFEEVARCYLKSADAMVDITCENRGTLDLHIYAICFAYRQSLELILKDLSWKSHYVHTGIKRYMLSDWKELGRHELLPIWRSGVEMARKTLQIDFPLDDEEVRELECFLAQYERHDPGSYSFRFPIGRKKQNTVVNRNQMRGSVHPDLTHVNVKVLRENVQQVHEYIRRILDLIEWCLDQLPRDKS